MIANALCHVSNMMLLGFTKPHQEVYCVGCDLQYPSDGPTHFYSGGTADPLRFTPEQLAIMLNQIKQKTDVYGIKIYVGQTDRPTALPFERKDPV
jgi:hypothetical protein